MTSEQRLDWICKKLEVIDEALRGNPSDPRQPGIQHRLMRLEESEARRVKAVWILAAAVVGQLVVFIAGKLF